MLEVGQILYFEYAGERHSITIKEITDSYIIATIASTPTDVRISRGDAIEHDVNDDGTNDVRLQLGGTTASTATLSIALIAQPNTSATANTPDTPNKAINLAGNFPIASAWILVIIAVGGLILLVFLKKQKKDLNSH